MLRNATTRLRDHARSLIAERAKTCEIKDLAIECGLPYTWFLEFSKGIYSDPSVNRVEQIIERLTGRQIGL